MSVPPFWPEKATEWIALVGGSLGGILGTLGFVMSILNYRRDRADVQLDFKSGMKIRIDPPNTYLVLSVWNRGRREVQIARADANFYTGDGGTLMSSVAQGPANLSEKSPEVSYLAREGEFPLDSVWFFSVADGARREYRRYVHIFPKRWFLALKNSPARLRLAHENRVRRRKRLDEPTLIVGGEKRS